MITTIHQVEHLVWLGLLDKISHSDLFVIFDDTQFKKNYFENRNKIRVKEGWMWLSVPVLKHSLDSYMKDIEISYDQPWLKKNLSTLQMNYSRAPFFEKYFSDVENIFNKKPKHLIDLNLDLLFFFFDAFGIKKKTVKSSELDYDRGAGGSDICLQICQAVETDVYLAGKSGKDYLELDKFKKAGVEVIFHDFQHPEYKQVYPKFEPYMTALDALFNLGDEARNLIFQNDKML